MKTPKMLVILACAWLLAACQTALTAPTPTATFVPATETALPTQTPVPTPTSIPTATPSPTATPAAGDTRVRQPDGMLQVYIPAGKFLLGTSPEQLELMLVQHPSWKRNLIAHEQPQQAVPLEAFWLDQTEVTNAMYAQCVAGGACQAPARNSSATREAYYGNPEYDDYPVIWVNWFQAQAYCTWAERRLPTEAEWEKAARGTDERRYPWGEKISCAQANYGGNCGGDTSPVGSYPEGASPYGALDMAGNVFEWVNSLYANYPYTAGPGRENLTDLENWRVLRGGSWLSDARGTRSAHRSASHPGMAEPVRGFRCASSTP